MLRRSAYRLEDDLRHHSRTRASVLPRRALLAYWGSLPNGHSTFGDRLALQALAGWLRERSLPFDVATYESLGPEFNPLYPIRLDPQRYGALVFVCGPLLDRHELMRLAYRFSHTPRIAVGVSVLPGNPRARRLYDAVFARDGELNRGGVPGFDLALAGDAPHIDLPPRPLGPVLRCVRGPQQEYGQARCRSAQAEAAIDQAAARLGLETEPVDTVLGPKPDDMRAVERAFEGSSLVLTTRLHGALLALRAGAPFVAIDQIVGGAKLSEVLGRLGWPHVLAVDGVTSEAVERAVREVTAPEFRPQLLACRSRAIELSRAALDGAGETVLRWM